MTRDVVWLTGGSQARTEGKVYLRRDHGEIQYGRHLGDVVIWWHGVRYDVEPGPDRIRNFSRFGQRN